MNYVEYLYTKLAEEASEIAQAAAKCNVFGEFNHNPVDRTAPSNIVALNQELNDLYAVLSLLNDVYNPHHIETQYPFDVLEQRIQDKMKKLKVQYEVSENLKKGLPND